MVLALRITVLTVLLIADILCADNYEENTEIDSSKARGKTVTSFFESTPEFYTVYNPSVFSDSPTFTEGLRVGNFENFDKLPRKLKSSKVKNLNESKSSRDSNKVPTTAEEIKAKYGDPNELPAVDPESLKDAPPALKGAVAAFNAGNIELAKAYLNKYAEYHETVTEYHKFISDYTNQTLNVRQIYGKREASGTKDPESQPFVEKFDAFQILERAERLEPQVKGRVSDYDDLTYQKLTQSFVDTTGETLEILLEKIIDDFSLGGEVTLDLLVNVMSSTSVPKIRDLLTVIKDLGGGVVTELNIVCYPKCLDFLKASVSSVIENLNGVSIQYFNVDFLKLRKDVELVIRNSGNGEGARFIESNAMILGKVLQRLSQR